LNLRDLLLVGISKVVDLVVEHLSHILGTNFASSALAPANSSSVVGENFHPAVKMFFGNR
jgi:hypothetical protein